MAKNLSGQDLSYQIQTKIFRTKFFRNESSNSDLSGTNCQMQTLLENLMMKTFTSIEIFHAISPMQTSPMQIYPALIFV